MAASPKQPGVEPGDYVYAHHPKHGPMCLKVLARGKDGFTAEDGDKGRHRLPHTAYLGHKTRMLHTLSVVDEGADGAILADAKGRRRFIAGELPRPKDATPEPQDDDEVDPLLKGLDKLRKARDLPPLLPSGATVLLLKAGQIAHRPGLALKDITDRAGRHSKHWVRTAKDEPAPRKAGEKDEPGKAAGKDEVHKHGDVVQFRHENVVGRGKLVASGKDGVTVQTEDGREHMVRHDALEKPLPEQERRPAPEVPAKAADAKPDDETAQIPPDQFEASTVYAEQDDPNATPETILADFPPDTAGKIAEMEKRVGSEKQTIELYRKGNGYTPERQAVHAKIIGDFLSEERIKAATPPAGQKPTFTILGGRGGSGKSWFEGNVYDPEKAIVLDADAIKKALPEYEGWNAALLHEESGDLFDAMTWIARDRGLNLVHDATMKTGSKAVKLVEEFKAAGYRAEAHYMFLPRQEAAKRAVQRFLGPTARLVPPSVVLSNTTNEKSFDQVKELVDAWSFRDNNVAKGEQPKLLSEKTDVSDTGDVGRDGRPAATGGPGSGAAGSSAAKGRTPGGGSPPGGEAGHYQMEKADRPGIRLFFKAIIRGGAEHDLFAQPTHVPGHLREGKFVMPYTAIRHVKPEAPPPPPSPPAAEAKPVVITATAAKASVERQKQAKKLREAGAKIRAQAGDDLNRDRLANTRKRAQQAASAVMDAQARDLIGSTMENLADAIERDEAHHLSGVNSRAQVELLESKMRSARWQADLAAKVPYRGRQDDREPVASDVQFARFPRLIGRDSAIEDAIGSLERRGGPADLIERLRAHPQGEAVIMSDALAKETLAALEAAGDTYSGWTWRDSLAEADRLRRMGVTDDASLQAALREYLDVRGERRKENPLKRMERELVGSKPGIDFFPTPEPLARHMVDLAEIRPGMRVLEPSAGKGDIADQIRLAGGEVETAEISDKLRAIIEAKGHKLVARDFAEFEPEQPYDRIVMNPPWSGGADVRHVMRAWDMLKPGGRLVALMSPHPSFAADKASVAFRDFLREHGGKAEKHDVEEFKSQWMPQGIASWLVTVDKPIDTPAPQGG